MSRQPDRVPGRTVLPGVARPGVGRRAGTARPLRPGWLTSLVAGCAGLVVAAATLPAGAALASASASAAVAPAAAAGPRPAVVAAQPAALLAAVDPTGDPGATMPGDPAPPATAPPAASPPAATPPAASPPGTTVPAIPPPPVPTTPPPPPPPPPLPTALGSWCEAIYPSRSWTTERRAAEDLMAGIVDLGKGGTYVLAYRPNWKPQRSADLSGNRHVNSLDWALPLLRVGVKAQNRPMVTRFLQLMRWWIADHRTAKSRTYWVDASIYGGKRTATLLCAAQTFGYYDLRVAALGEAGRMLGSFRSTAQVAYGTNNTDLIRQDAAFAAFCWSNNRPKRDRAWGNLVRIARGVVMDDGSDVEGSPYYATYIEQLLRTIEGSAALCGTSAEPIPTLRQRVYGFVAQAVRPDWRLESLGDGVAAPVAAGFGVGNPTADWVRTQGQQGPPPTTVFSTYSGGYAFGRDAWPAAGQSAGDTFWSLRWTSARPATAHTHDDGGALTFFSRGTSWIGDPGPYRYDSSAFRSYVRGRSAHSSVTVTGVKRTWARGVRLQSATAALPTVRAATGPDESVCVQDRTWSSVLWTRCVRHLRGVDALVVTDSLAAADITPPPPPPCPTPPPTPKPTTTASAAPAPKPVTTPSPKPTAPPTAAPGPNPTPSPTCTPPPKPKPPAARTVTQRWALPPGVGLAGAPGGPDPASGLSWFTLTSAGGALDVVSTGPGGWSVSPAAPGGLAGWFTGVWGQRLPGGVASRSTTFAAAGGTARWVTVLLPRSAGETPTASIDANAVTVIRDGVSVTVPVSELLRARR